MKPTPQASKTQDRPDPVQGEGDYRAAKRYDESVKSFVKHGKVSEAARKAAPRSPQEAEELKSAERAGVAHSKGDDPVSRRAPGRKPDPL